MERGELAESKEPEEVERVETSILASMGADCGYIINAIIEDLNNSLGLHGAMRLSYWLRDSILHTGLPATLQEIFCIACCPASAVIDIDAAEREIAAAGEANAQLDMQD